MGMKGKMVNIYQVTHLILFMNKALKRTQLDQRENHDMFTIFNINIDCLTEKGRLTLDMKT